MHQSDVFLVERFGRGSVDLDLERTYTANRHIFDAQVGHLLGSRFKMKNG
jgi:hypothetical protein